MAKKYIKVRVEISHYHLFFKDLKRIVQLKPMKTPKIPPYS